MEARLIGHLVRVERRQVVLGHLYGVVVWNPTATLFFFYGDGLLSAEGAVVVAEVHSLQLDDRLVVTFEVSWTKHGSHELTVTKFEVNL